MAPRPLLHAIDPHDGGTGDDALLAAIGDFTWEWDAALRWCSLSSEFAAATGLAPAALLGTAHDAGGAPAELRAAQLAHSRIAARHAFRDLVLTCPAPGGGTRRLRLLGVPRHDGDGRFIGYRGAAWDVSAEGEELTELKRRAARFGLLFDSITDWFWEHDEQGRLTFVSGNFTAITGQAVKEVLGRRVSELPGATIDAEIGQRTFIAIRDQQPFRDFVYGHRGPEGRTVWVRSSGVPLRDADGRFRGYWGIAKDVSVEILAERALRDSEQRFRELFETAADYYWEIDATSRMTHVDPVSVHDSIYGMPYAELHGKRISEFSGVRFDTVMGTRILKAQKAHAPFRDIIFSIQRQDGSVAWVSISAAPMVAEDGTFLGYRGVGANVTPRVELETQMRLAHGRLQDAMSYVQQPVAMFDADDRLVAFNQAFADLYRQPKAHTRVFEGISLTELAEWQLHNSFFADDDPAATLTVEALVEDLKGDGQQTHHLSDGRWMQVTHPPLPGGGRIALWADVTELKVAEQQRVELEQRLHHSQRLEALGTLAGGVAHELNNAMVPILTLTKLVLRKLPEGSRERGNLDMVMTAAERSRDLVKQILAFSRKHHAHHAQMDLAAVIDEALAMLRASLPSSITLERDVAPVPPVSGDSGQIHQVIVNLVTNASHAIGDRPGTIRILLGPGDEGEQVRLSVVDSGCGMDEATRVRVFEPFFTTKEVGQGTGLGLAVVHGIITSHNGRIEVSSTVGKGTRFDVILPAGHRMEDHAA